VGTPGPLISPVTWSSPDYLGRVISVTFTFDNVTLVLAAVTVTRDAGCMYRNLYFGLGAGGIPDTTAKVFGNVAAGVVAAVPGALLASYGFSTMTDVLAGQITAGP
jgi:hypothetical protein